MFDGIGWPDCVQCSHVIKFSSRKNASKYLKGLRLTHDTVAKETWQLPWSTNLGMLLSEHCGQDPLRASKATFPLKQEPGL